MANYPTSSSVADVHFRWSNRILLAALAGILFLTLFPFRIDTSLTPVGGRSAFLLGNGPKTIGAADIFLNVLLFVPFGFGLGEKLREEGRSPAGSFTVCLLAGVVFSYSIEFAQIYIPPRNSGWLDVFTNGSGSAVGCLLYNQWGVLVLRRLSQFERWMERHVTMLRLAYVLPVYFAICFALSVPLQRQTRLVNWASNASLTIGSAVSKPASAAWKGRVFGLDLWSKALPKKTEQELSLGASPSADFEPAVAYKPHGISADRKLALEPSETAASQVDASADPEPLAIRDVGSAPASISNFNENVQSSGQFAFRIECAPASTRNVQSAIFSLSSPSGVKNLEVQQLNRAVEIHFRSVLSPANSMLNWTIPDVFSASQRVRTMVVSYDGSVATAYINGAQALPSFQLGPGLPLVHTFIRIKTGEIEAYICFYYSLIFLPPAILLGIAERKLVRPLLGRSLSILVLVIFSLLLELILVGVSGRFFSAGNLTFSIAVAVAGFVWINADRNRISGPQGATC